MPRAELMGRSIVTGAQATRWAYVQSVANSTWPTPNIINQDSLHASFCLAAALSYARTGNAAHRTKAINGIMAVTNTFTSVITNGALSVGRQLAGYVLAADFCDMTGTQDTDFRDFVLQMLTINVGSQNNWESIVKTHNNADNNWGGWNGGARIIGDIYLGRATDLAAAADTFRGFLGDRSYHTGFKFQNGGADANQESWMCNPDPAVTVPINPACTKSGINVDGCSISDISRSATPSISLSLRWPPDDHGAMYSNEVLCGVILQAEGLYRHGYPDIYAFRSSAVKRMGQVLTRISNSGGQGWNRGAVQNHIAWLLNARYNAGFPTVPANHGRSFGYTDWLYGPY